LGIRLEEAAIRKQISLKYVTTFRIAASYPIHQTCFVILSEAKDPIEYIESQLRELLGAKDLQPTNPNIILTTI